LATWTKASTKIEGVEFTGTKRLVTNTLKTVTATIRQKILKNQLISTINSNWQQ